MNDTPDDFEHLPVEVQLSAYLDNELPEHLAQQLTWRLQSDGSLRELLGRLEVGSHTGNRMFEILLKEPLPLAFARAIRRGEGILAKLSAYDI